MRVEGRADRSIQWMEGAIRRMWKREGTRSLQWAERVGNLAALVTV
jgi:hypothetical protein